MRRYLAPSPAQWDYGQQRRIAEARFGPIIDINEVDNGDGTRSLAVYLEAAANGGIITGWRTDVLGAVYSPDPTPGNQAFIVKALADAIVDMQAILDTADIPTGTTLTAGVLSNVVRQLQSQVKAEAQVLKRLARYVIGDFTGTG